MIVLRQRCRPAVALFTCLFVAAAVPACKEPAGGAAPWLTAPDATTHEVHFPIAAGPHAVGCDQCHGKADSFREFDCLTCHEQKATDPLHSGNAEYRWASPRCYACHPRGTGTLSPDDHARYFPITPGSAHALGKATTLGAGVIGCTGCHVDPAQRRVVDCTGCHDAASMKTSSGTSFHAAVPDLPAGFAPGPDTSRTLCLRCHAASKIPTALLVSTAKVQVHDASYGFRISAGTPHAAGTRADGKCFTCHSQTTTLPEVLTTTGPLVVADFSQQTCTACHAPAGSLAQDVDALHLGLGPVAGVSYTPLSTPPVPADSKTCLRCHADGGIGSYDHTRWFPVGAAADSHQLGKLVALAGGGAVSITCATCHQDVTTRSNVTCSGCHTNAGTNAAGPAAIDLGPAHASVAGTQWRAPGTPTNQCLLCHALDLDERLARHGAGTQAFPSAYPGIVFPVASGPHQVACDKCHGALAPAGGELKNPRIDFAQRSCDACHTEAKERLVGIHASIGLTVADPVGPDNAGPCLKCHPDGGAAPASTPGYQHAYFPIATGPHAMGAPAVHAAGNVQCTSCHTALTTDPSRIDCTGCHTKAQLTPGGVSMHAAVPDLVWPATPDAQGTSLLCLRCHADGAVPVAVGYSTTTTKGRHDPTNAAIRFDVTRGALHDTSGAGMPCLTCHAQAKAPFPALPSLLVADFTQQTCTACHLLTGTLKQDLNALHAGVTTPAPGFTPVPSPVTPAYSATCLQCHPTGAIDATIAAQNHGNFFPIAQGTSHAYGSSVTVKGVPRGIACASCHADSTDRANVDCTVCHFQTGSNGTPGPGVPADQTTAHAGKVGTTDASGAPHNLWLGTGPVSGGAGESARCLACHLLDAQPGGFVGNHGKASAATGNVVFPIAAGGPHFTACDQCHTATLAPAQGRQDASFDFARASCDKCHLPTGAQSVIDAHAGFGYPITDPYTAGDPNNASACLSCHPDGAQAKNFTHAWFPIAQGSAHDASTVPCKGCHADPSTYSGDPSANLSKITCTACHDDSAANVGNQNGVTITAAHSAARVGRDIWDVPGGKNYADNALCLKCHAGNIATAAGDPMAAFSTPLVFRLRQHDAHCALGGHPITSGDLTHTVNQNTNNTASTGGSTILTTIVPVCFGCHAATLPSTSATPWAVDWTQANPKTMCTSCHKHLPNDTPLSGTYTCK